MKCIKRNLVIQCVYNTKQAKLAENVYNKEQSLYKFVSR